MAGLGSRLVGWLRSTEEASPSSDGVVTVTLHGDQYAARAIAAECHARGLNVQMVVDRIVTHPTTVGATFDLLVLTDDVDEVREIASKQDRLG